MAEKLRTIRLYGSLGTQFGRVHRLAVASAAEAVRAMCVVLPGFEKTLAESAERGACYAFFLGKKNIPEDQLSHPVGDAEIRIAPILAGSKRGGLFQTIAGVALVVIGAAINYFSMGSLSYIGTPVMQMGAALAIGGVVQMLSPQQRGLSAKDSPENGASYNFNGPVNTSAQGNPVPLLYGEMFVGSAVISAGIAAEDQV